MSSRLLGALLLVWPLGLYSAPVRAQTAQPLSSCGSITYTANGVPMPLTQDATGKLCTSVAGGSGVATAANQATEISSLATIAANSSAGTANTGSATPSSAIYLGGSSSGNLTGLVLADNSVSIAITTATTTQLVALSSGKVIYVTGYDITVAAAQGFALVYGTGAACATGTTYLIGGSGNVPAYAVNGGISKGGAMGVILKTPASNALCAVTTAAASVAGSLQYTQQ